MKHDRANQNTLFLKVFRFNMKNMIWKIQRQFNHTD